MAVTMSEGYHWIEGLTTDSRGKERWTPLYNYEDRRLAKAHLGLIINEEGNSRELAMLEAYEDFRIRQDEGYQAIPQKATRPSRRPVSASDETLKVPAKGKIKRSTKGPKGRQQ